VAAAAPAHARAARASCVPRQRPPLLTQADDVGDVVARRVCHADVVGDGERCGIVERDKQRGRHGLGFAQRDGHVFAVPGHALLRRLLRRTRPIHVHLRVQLGVGDAQRCRVDIRVSVSSRQLGRLALG
jgi:hypothetical protein